MRYSVLLLALMTSAALAQPVMTTFDPAADGFLFDNRFRNQFTRDIETAGLCGGMVYAALDYRAAADRARPAQWFRPAQGTALRQYLYDRNVNQIVSNVDRWVELGANPGGARSSEYFSWGLEGSPSRQFERIKASVDAGQPVPLGLQGCGPDCCGPNGDKCSGNHVILAIGYEENASPRENKIFVYDPNFPTQTLTMVPRPDDPDGGPFYTYTEYEGRTTNEGVALDQRWLTYYADMNYSPRRPPITPRLQYPNDGKVHALVLHFQTGGDDFRGGNIGVTITTWDRRTFTFPNVNTGDRWLGNTTEPVLVELGAGVDRELFKDITITTPMSGGIGGDNWNLDALILDVLPDVGDRRLIRFPARGQQPVHRFTGKAPTWTGEIMRDPLINDRAPTTLEQGFDRPGYDYRSFTVTSDNYRQGCQQVCDRDTECAAWTYVTSTRTCWLKDDLPPKVPNSGTISGIKFTLVAEDVRRQREGAEPEAPTERETPLFPESDRTTLELRTDRPGSDYRNFTVRGGNYRVGCQRVCEQDGRCQAWTFVRSSSTCWLKNGLPAKRPHEDAISGIRMSLIRQDLDR